MKTLYLHIGIHKTGTTALQNALRKNDKTLLRNNIIFPRKGCVGKSNHSHLAWEQYKKEAFDPARGGIADVVTEIASSECSTAILSGEDFEFFFDNKHIEAFHSAVKDHFNVFVVVYLRRQDNVLRSEFIQWVKTGYVDSDFDLFCKFFSTHSRFFYHNLVDRWAKVFGKEKMIVRVYEKERLKNRNIVHDFLHAIGQEGVIGSMKVDDKQVNVSPRYKNVLAMLLINRLYRIMYKRPQAKPLADVLNQVDALVNATFRDNEQQYVPMSRKEAKGLLHFFEVSNRYVAREYVAPKARELFSPVSEGAESPQVTLSRGEMDTLYSWFLKHCA